MSPAAVTQPAGTLLNTWWQQRPHSGGESGLRLKKGPLPEVCSVAYSDMCKCILNRRSDADRCDLRGQY